MNQEISPAAVKLARQFAALSQAEAAEKAGLRQADLSLIERGLAPNRIDDDRIRSLAAALGFTKDFLCDVVHFREPTRPMQRAAKTGIRASEIGKTLALANIVQQHLGQIMRDYIDLEVDIPNLSQDVVSSPTTAATSLRQFWGIDENPVRDVTALCERYGIVIYSGHFPSDSIVGFTMDQSTTGLPIVFVNEAIPTDRRRLTLAHELGHLVRRHDLALDDENHIESEAWQFAGEFLVPERELRADVRIMGGVVSLRMLADLKRKWGVSMASLAKRLNDIGELPSGKYQSVYVQLSRAGYRRREPVEVPPESENILSSMFKMMREDLGVDLQRLTAELKITSETFRELYGKYWGGIESRLRLVK